MITVGQRRPWRRLALCVGVGLAGCAQQPAPPLATQPSATQEVKAVVQNQVQITFPPGSSRLSHEADAQLDLAARLFRDVNPVAMF